MEDIAVKVVEIDQRSKSNTHRLDKVEERQDNLDKLVSSVSALANEQEHIKEDVTEIKTDVKSLTERPGKRWDSIVGGHHHRRGELHRRLGAQGRDMTTRQARTAWVIQPSGLFVWPPTRSIGSWVAGGHLCFCVQSSHPIIAVCNCLCKFKCSCEQS